MKSLEVRDICFNYGGLNVLEDVSFHVGSYEKVAIIGPNGAGKTTLLSVIGGQLSPQRGRIFLSGRDITSLPAYRRARSGLSRSFQTNSLFFGLPVIENVLIALKGCRSSGIEMIIPLRCYKDTLRNAEMLLESVGLLDKKNVLMSEISHGEQRQIEILLSIISKPSVLLLDEPSAGLSIEESANFSKMTKELLGNTTILFSAHDLDLVSELSERILVLYYGKVIAEGRPEEIYGNRMIQEIYLGTETTIAQID